MSKDLKFAMSRMDIRPGDDDESAVIHILNFAEENGEIMTKHISARNLMAVYLNLLHTPVVLLYVGSMKLKSDKTMHYRDSYFLVKPVSELNKLDNEPLCWARYDDGMYYPARIVEKNLVSRVAVVSYLYFDEQSRGLPMDDLYANNGFSFIIASALGTNRQCLLKVDGTVRLDLVMSAIECIGSEFSFKFLLPFEDQTLETFNFFKQQKDDDADAVILKVKYQWSARFRKGLHGHGQGRASVYDFAGKNYCVNPICSRLRPGDNGFHLTDKCPYIVRCTNCRSQEHHAIDCPEPFMLTCHKCYEEGHFFKDCPSPYFKCRHCEAFGHKQTNCPFLFNESDEARSRIKPAVVEGVTYTPEQRMQLERRKHQRQKDFIQRYTRDQSRM